MDNIGLESSTFIYYYMTKEVQERFINLPHELCSHDIKDTEEHNIKFINYLTDNGRLPCPYITNNYVHPSNVLL
jgi:hypothetical protein